MIFWVEFFCFGKMQAIRPNHLTMLAELQSLLAK
jgi:hypothetical protein